MSKKNPLRDAIGSIQANKPRFIPKLPAKTQSFAPPVAKQADLPPGHLPGGTQPIGNEPDGYLPTGGEPSGQSPVPDQPLGTQLEGNTSVGDLPSGKQPKGNNDGGPLLD